jgi:hypothetical protein
MFGGKQVRVPYEPGLDLACKEFTWEVRKGALPEYKIWTYCLGGGMRVRAGGKGLLSVPEEYGLCCLRHGD